ncbi:PhoX family protein [Nakamurella leprariae]|uniref:PhoX family phosphatase n=1 Tax=Nakamurella leprariae TaxID=2803911 RepID=A0A938YBD9_9ACTN|nr:PhoX family phosphatase [Nakamurella leprariae]
MFGHTRGKRSAVTCHLKCDDACAKHAPNETANPTFHEIANAALSRRMLLRGAGAGALTLVVGSQLVGGAPEAAAAVRPAGSRGGWDGAWRGGKGGSGNLRFAPIAPVDQLVDDFTVPEGYTWDTIIRWGDPLFDVADVFDAAHQTPELQARQFGYNNDYLDIIVIPWATDEALLVSNHEYTNHNIMFPETADAAMLACYRKVEMEAHGLSVVHLTRERDGAPWSYTVGNPYNRRHTVTTEFTLSGPVAGSDLVKTVADPSGRTVFGTLNNCAGGTTPWGTVLSGEENFNGYFVGRGTDQEARYGISTAATSYGFETIDPRFDANNAGYEQEAHRFGWIVEVDPFEPQDAPVKHTALGRFKHEAGSIQVGASGHVGVYMGDDERFDYLYKFVSKDTMDPDVLNPASRPHNKQLLTDGTLYVARFTGDSPAAEIDGTGTVPSDGAFDGTGEWIPLVREGVSLVPGFTAEEALVFTRLAADAVGATKMDRPEDVQPNPKTGKVYVACTNNTNRGLEGRAPADEVNPRTANRDGHVIEITEDADVTGTTFSWNILLLCGDPSDPDTTTYFSGFPAEKVSPISCPDNLAFDSRGNLWISTDGQPGTIGYNDGLFKVTLEGPERGRVEQFLAVPREAETCGPVIHDEDGMVFVNVQHPGEDGTWTEQTSYFPDYVAEGATPAPGDWRGPRPSVVQVYRSKRGR